MTTQAQRDQFRAASEDAATAFARLAGDMPAKAMTPDSLGALLYSKFATAPRCVCS